LSILLNYQHYLLGGIDMKKIFAIVAVVALAFSLVACGNTETADPDATTTEVTEETTTTEVTEEETATPDAGEETETTETTEEAAE
jgi:ABC-type glycerol-3-phosphate transport system substrate-binding protein